MLINLAYYLKYEESRLGFYSGIRSEIALQKQGKFSFFDLIRGVSEIDRFSSFDSPLGYFGRVPSRKFLTKLITVLYAREENYIFLEQQRRCGKFLYVDHSHKVTKHLHHFGDTKLYSGLFSGLNEYGEVRLLQFVQGTSYAEVEESLKRYYHTSTFYGVQPNYLWTDKCCSDRANLENFLPSVRKGTLSLLDLPLPANCQQCNCQTDVQSHIEPILSKLDTMGSDELLHIGLDLEWPVSLTGEVRGKCGKVACIQIATAINDGVVLVFLTKGWQYFPNSLKYLLEHPRVIKCGKRIQNDANHLSKDWGIKIPKRSLLELSDLYHQIPGNRRNASLQKMTEDILVYTLPKDQDIRYIMTYLGFQLIGM